MRAAAASFALVTSGLVSACASSTDSERSRSLSVTLTAARINAGETGRAILVPLRDRTQVNLVVSGVAGELVSRPVHLYTFVYAGSCASPASQPADALTQRVLAQSPTSAAIASTGGALTVTNLAPISIDALRQRDHSIRVMTSPADGNRELFCGDVR